MKTQRIAIVGPESTGKSTLSQMLAKHYQTVWVPEYARKYLNQLNRPYQENDLLEIARGQLQWEDEFLPQANQFLFCDTNLLVIKIWSQFKFGHCNPWILAQLGQRKYALHLLTYIDIPWQDDPQREHPHLRNELYGIYREELDQLGIPFKIVKGDPAQRLNTALDHLEKIKSKF
ncbi:MAG: AAA family ATPase [Candidatus Cyclobacteriaceae bacterium M3_2C_046]